MTRIENLTSKTIEEFIAGEDTIYITRMASGCQISYLCEFVSYQRGVVVGKAISCEPKWALRQHEIEKGVELKARLSKCYLFGLSKDDPCNWPTCHWFDGKTKKVER